MIPIKIYDVVYNAKRINMSDESFSLILKIVRQTKLILQFMLPKAGHLVLL